jgi:ribosome-binding protein aMBF1 (putative translation factor)
MKSITEVNTFSELLQECCTPEEREEINFQADLLCKCAVARREKGLSQKQLAEKSGLKQPAVARIESLSTSPRVETLIKLLYPLGYKLAIVPIDTPKSV